MKFKASLLISYVTLDYNIKTNSLLEFSKTQLFYPVNANLKWSNSCVTNGAHYKLIVHDKIGRDLKYEINIENITLIGLQISLNDERKLKWIHKLYGIQKKSIVYSRLITALTLLTTFIVTSLGLKRKG